MGLTAYTIVSLEITDMFLEERRMGCGKSF
jgi:hypothetical protein